MAGLAYRVPGLTLSALSPNENKISLYMITTCLNIEVTRIEEVITEDKMS